MRGAIASWSTFYREYMGRWREALPMRTVSQHSQCNVCVSLPAHVDYPNLVPIAGHHTYHIILLKSLGLTGDITTMPNNLRCATPLPLHFFQQRIRFGFLAATHPSSYRHPTTIAIPPLTTPSVFRRVSTRGCNVFYTIYRIFTKFKCLTQGYTWIS